jgi:hypothetical protein
MGDEVNQTLQREAAKRAQAEPLPGALGAAFLNGDIDVQGIKVRRVVATDWKVLKWLKSPILQQILELQKPAESREEIFISDEDEYEMCFQFIHSPKRMRELMGGTREDFRKLATEEIADKLDNAIVKAIVVAVSEQFIVSFQTALQFFPKDEAEKKT